MGLIPQVFKAKQVGCKNCHHPLFIVGYNFEKGVLVLKCPECGTAVFFSVKEMDEGNVVEVG